MTRIHYLTTDLEGEELKKILIQKYRTNRSRIKLFEEENKAYRKYVMCNFSLDISKGRYLT